MIAMDLGDYGGYDGLHLRMYIVDILATKTGKSKSIFM